jgi:hypothetical protein
MNAPVATQLLQPQGSLPDLVDRYAEARALADAAAKELHEAKAALYAEADVSLQPLDQPIVLVGRRFHVQLSAAQKERKFVGGAMQALHSKFGNTLLDLVTLSLATFDRLIPDAERSQYVETQSSSTRKTTVVERR